jgi:hypothetical protein
MYCAGVSLKFMTVRRLINFGPRADSGMEFSRPDVRVNSVPHPGLLHLFTISPDGRDCSKRCHFRQKSGDRGFEVIPMVHDIFALKQPVIIWPYPDDSSRINAAAQKPDDRVHSRFACPDNGECVMLWRMARRAFGGMQRHSATS